jgi:hypothetical protein
MRSRLTHRTRRYLTDAALAFERAPVEVVLVVCIAISFSIAVEMGDDAFPRWIEIAVTAALMAAAAWTATLLHGLGVFSVRTRWAVTLAGAAAAGLYGGFVLNVDRAAEAWRAAMLVGAAVLWLAAVPVFGRWRGLASDPAAPDAAVDLMRTVTGRTLLRVLGALLYSAALFAGLALALGAINTLFELNLEGSIYAHVFGWIFFVLAPWIVIGGIEEYLRPADARPEVMSVVHRMTAFLVPPLLVLYLAILYAYTIRIAVTGEVPKNLVSPMVLAAGALAVLALLLFDPRPGESATARTLRSAPPLFIPLAALGVWTIWTRLDQYGLTEFRLLRLIALGALGVLAIAATIQVMRRQRLMLYVAPLVLAAALFGSALVVPALARTSQQARLEQALRAADIDAHTAPVRGAGTAQLPQDTARRTVASASYDQINSVTRYLVEHFGAESLPPAVALRITQRSDVYDASALLGLRRSVDDVVGPRFIGSYLPGPAAISIGDVTAHRVSAGSRRGTPEPDAAALRLSAGSYILSVRVGGVMMQADITPIVMAHDGLQRRSELPPELAQTPLRDAAGVERGTLLVLEINAEISEAGEVVLRNLQGIALVTSAPSH